MVAQLLSIAFSLGAFVCSIIICIKLHRIEKRRKENAENDLQAGRPVDNLLVDTPNDRGYYTEDQSRYRIESPRDQEGLELLQTSDPTAYTPDPRAEV